jgi:uncharacterized protein
MATAEDPTRQLPVTMAAVRSARSGKQTSLETWAHSLCSIALGFPGCVGCRVSYLDPSASRILVSVTFATAQDLLQWQDSQERHEHLRRGEPLTDGRPVPVAGSVEPAQSSSATEGAQPRWLLALLVWLGLYPPALLINVYLRSMFTSWPVALSTLVITGALVVFVVFFSLPLLQRVARRVMGWADV